MPPETLSNCSYCCSLGLAKISSWYSFWTYQMGFLIVESEYRHYYLSYMLLYKTWYGTLTLAFSSISTQSKLNFLPCCLFRYICGGLLPHRWRCHRWTGSCIGACGTLVVSICSASQKLWIDLLVATVSELRQDLIDQLFGRTLALYVIFQTYSLLV